MKKPKPVTPRRAKARNLEITKEEKELLYNCLDFIKNEWDVDAEGVLTIESLLIKLENLN